MYRLKQVLMKFVYCSILSKKKKDKFKSKYLYVMNPDNKILQILPDGREEVLKHRIKGLQVLFEGKNNVLRIYDEKVKNVKVTFHGDNSTAVVRDNTICSLRSNCFYSIDKTSYTNDVKIWLDDDNAQVKIGKNCAISWDIEFMAADCHTILDEAGNICNMPKPIEIKDHVWIGCGVKICKGVTIAENNIIGMGSVVTKSFSETNCVIAGNPAKIVKHNVNWDVKMIKDYVASYSQKK